MRPDRALTHREHMNEFVNPKKRGIQLPPGSKDLVDVLHAKRRKQIRKGKCDYCGAPAVSVSIAFEIPGVLDEEAHRWCEQCQRDLAEFAARPENSLPDDLDLDDDAAMERAMQQFAERQKREKEFMRQRVKERR